MLSGALLPMMAPFNTHLKAKILHEIDQISESNILAGNVLKAVRRSVAALAAKRVIMRQLGRTTASIRLNIRDC
jgi:hypothetical protein